MFARAALTFLYISFVFVLHLKLPSWTFFGRKFRRCFCSLFCFTGVHSRGCLAFLISSSPLYFFHVFIQRDGSPLFIISRPTSFSIIHVSVDIKILSKKRFDFVIVFLSLKVRVATRFTAKRRGWLKCKILPRLTERGVRTYRRFCQNQNLTTFWYVWTTTSSPFFCMLQPVNNCLQ